MHESRPCPASPRSDFKRERTKPRDDRPWAFFVCESLRRYSKHIKMCLTACEARDRLRSNSVQRIPEEYHKLSFQSVDLKNNAVETLIRNSTEAGLRINEIALDQRKTVRAMLSYFFTFPILFIRGLTTTITTKYDSVDSAILSMFVVFPISLLSWNFIRSPAASLQFNTTLFSICCIVLAYFSSMFLIMQILKDRPCERISGRSTRRNELSLYFPTLVSYWRKRSQLQSEMLRLRDIRTAYIREESRQDEIDELLATDLRLLDGIGFERHLEKIFEVLGYDDVERTKATGDQGVDLVVTDGSQRIAVQAKLYSGNVGNDAVQQVVAGMAIYNCDRCVVITNSEFTNSARELARANGCKLINGCRLLRIIRGEADL